MKITTLKIRAIVLTLLCILTAAIWNGGTVTKALTIDQTASPSDGQKTEEGSITGKVQGAEKTFSLVAPRAGYARGWETVGSYIDDNVTEGGINFGAFHPPGSGTEDDPYLISTPEQLAWFSYKVNGRPPLCGTVTADLDMTGEAYGGTKASPLPWLPIGMDQDYHGSLLSAITRYTGTFDGGEHTISGLYVRSGDFQYAAGLFGAVSGSTIKNIVVKDSKVSSGLSMSGSIAGLCEGNTVISNCFSNAAVGGAVFCGGIAGSCEENVRVEKCGFTGQVTGGAYLGGIVGYGKNTIADCFLRVYWQAIHLTVPM